MLEKRCLVCGKVMPRLNQRYCSMGCYNSVRDIPVATCPNCGKEFKIPGSRQKYCSKKCSEIAQTGKSLPRKDRVNNGSGYIYIRVPADHPFASMRTKTGYVLEHRFVMATKLGRPLLTYETPHHRNGIRTDNSPNNLELRSKFHGKGATHHCLTCTCDQKPELLENPIFQIWSKKTA